MSDSRAPEVRDLGQVTFHIEGPLGIVTLNRPEVLNAQGYELLAQVDQAFDLAQADQAIRVVIVRGAGGVFSAGHDLSPGQQRGDDPLERYSGHLAGRRVDARVMAGSWRQRGCCRLLLAYPVATTRL
jgi:enoyl-CoA hydratase/carnithine racemase